MSRATPIACIFVESDTVPVPAQDQGSLFCAADLFSTPTSDLAYEANKLYSCVQNEHTWDRPRARLPIMAWPRHACKHAAPRGPRPAESTCRRRQRGGPQPSASAGGDDRSRPESLPGDMSGHSFWLPLPCAAAGTWLPPARGPPGVPQLTHSPVPTPKPRSSPPCVRSLSVARLCKRRSRQGICGRGLSTCAPARPPAYALVCLPKASRALSATTSINQNPSAPCVD